jgi:subtilisin family serine protease
MADEKIKCRRPTSKSILSQVTKPIRYSPADFGFDRVEGDGLGVRVCVIDSGLPVHADLKPQKERCIDFTESTSGIHDLYGHSTAVSGLMFSDNSKAIVGLSSKADVYHVKGLNDTGAADYNNIIAGLLWSVVQKVDIVVMAFGSRVYSQTLHDAVRKAYRSGISMFAAGGNQQRGLTPSDYPAHFPEVMGVCWSGSKRTKETGNWQSKPLMLNIPVRSVTTTYLDNSFAKMSGSSMLTAATAGVAARMLRNARSNGKKMSCPSDLYSALMSCHKTDK